MTPLEELENAERSYRRVRAELEALSDAELSPLHVDVVNAASVALGVAERVRSFREPMSRLPGFDVRHVDNLVDYARAAWFAVMTSHPAEASVTLSTDELALEVAALRAKLLMWATPLVGSGYFDETVVARLKEDSGLAHWSGDLAALLGLFRARWDEVKGICGVTEADLERGSRVGTELRARLSRREEPCQSAASTGVRRVQRAWTLLDRAYRQCSRAVWYLRGDDVTSLLPSLLRRAEHFDETSSAPFPAANAVGRDDSLPSFPTLISALPPESELRSLDAGAPYGN